LRPYFKSEEPTFGEDGIVKTFVGTNFERRVLNKMKDVVVFFHSVWCLECTDIMPLYE